ncbi:prolactin-releasing peptide receptor [Biomphalaria pfeifferi]|uniref:Prolactin-releasing peptide receptor n=1 Tax=Biomphalaria pfeifferi TaxID=112525 RepID=A0AAD8FCR3_BIOPF|nr:prolactin-releasing peptide receptor [Biomphalaria pfeifferi]
MESYSRSDQLQVIGLTQSCELTELGVSDNGKFSKATRPSFVVIFVLCWMPLNMVHISRDAEPSFYDWNYFTLIFFIAHVIAMSSTIYNPFLYAWMNDNFKKEFRQVLPCLFFGRGGGNGSSTYTQYTNVETQQPSVIMNRSPIKNGTADSAVLMKDVKAYYDTDSEKVRLNVLPNNLATGNHLTSSNNSLASNHGDGKLPTGDDRKAKASARETEEDETAT